MDLAGKKQTKRVVRALNDWNKPRFVEQDEFCRASLKVNKIKGNTKIMVFPAVSVEYSEVLRSRKGSQWTEREWKIGVDENKVRKAKFCRYLHGGCLQAVGTEDTKSYLAKVVAEAAKRENKKKKKKVA